MTDERDLLVGVGPGDVLAGKYRVERILGAGGMGVVVAAQHIQLDEKVALKFLLPDALKKPEAVRRFLREARAAVKIKSEHVARVSDVGQLENGSPYMVMEFLDGGDLAGWLEKSGAMPVAQAVDFILQACEAIAEAHSLGIVHRDLKPANLFCIRRPDGQLSIKVLDFGISKLTTPEDEGNQMTRTTAILGTPYYMSPEQLQASRGVDARSDIWALGVILFQLIAGMVPFQAEAMTELVIKIATQPAPPIRSVRADVPPGMEQIIARCLEKDRERRYSSVGELAVALLEFGSERARASVERISGTLRSAGIPQVPLPPSGASGLATTAAFGRTGPPSANTSTLAWWAGGGLACALLAVGALVIGRGGSAAQHGDAAHPSDAGIASTGAAHPSSEATAAEQLTPPSTAPIPIVAEPAVSTASSTPSRRDTPATPAPARKGKGDSPSAAASAPSSPPAASSSARTLAGGVVDDNPYQKK
jgi:serine/threonine-protein kinase